MQNKSHLSLREGASVLFSFQNSFSPLLFTGICALSLLSVSISVALADDEEELPTIALGSVVVVGAPAQTSPFKQTQTATDLSKNLVQDERDLPTFGTTNRIDRDGRRLERFTAPRRNFAISIEGRF